MDIPISQSRHPEPEDTDVVLRRTVAEMRPGWSVLADFLLDGEAGHAARARYALVHPHFGIALLDVAPMSRTRDAVGRVRRLLDAEQFRRTFGDYPPIVHRRLPASMLPRLRTVLDRAF